MSYSVKSMGKRIVLGAAAALCAVGTLAASQEGERTVKVPSLEVKERLQSIEQINVTAEKPVQEQAPISNAVAEALREAELLDTQTRAAETRGTSTERAVKN
ncbi:MAG: hypothetical protein AAF513_00680 [Pseudomonadota bacterium]